MTLQVAKPRNVGTRPNSHAHIATHPKKVDNNQQETTDEKKSLIASQVSETSLDSEVIETSPGAEQHTGENINEVHNHEEPELSASSNIATSVGPDAEWCTRKVKEESNNHKEPEQSAKGPTVTNVVTHIMASMDKEPISSSSLNESE